MEGKYTYGDLTVTDPIVEINSISFNMLTATTSVDILMKDSKDGGAWSFSTQDRPSDFNDAEICMLFVENYLQQYRVEDGLWSKIKNFFK